MTAPAQPYLEQETAFIAALGKLERGPLAELRRSLSFGPGEGRNGQSYFLTGLIYEHLPEWYRGGWGFQAAFLVAGLYSLVERPHSDAGTEDKKEDASETAKPEKRQFRNLGQDLGRLYRDQGERASTEKRFLALLDADEEQLSDRLRQAVTLLNAGDIRPNWAQLLNDVLSWNQPERRNRVRDRWARAFYQPGTAATSDTRPADSATAETDSPASEVKS